MERRGYPASWFLYFGVAVGIGAIAGFAVHLRFLLGVGLLMLVGSGVGVFAKRRPR